MRSLNDDAVAIGFQAGYVNQGPRTTAIGMGRWTLDRRTLDSAIAVGYYADFQ